MRSARRWARLLGVEQAVVERVEFDEDAAAIVVAVRPRKGVRRRCGRCGRRCSGFDRGEGRRRWRALDLGVVRAYLEAEAPRVCCPEHRVVVAGVPWACHGAGHTRAFDDTAAWLAVHTSKQAVHQLLGVAWATVGRIVTRVVADAEQATDRFAGLTRIGIDELSSKQGHRYLTVVVDHDTGRLVWAAPGHDATTLGCVLDALGLARCQQVRLVSADAAPWIAKVVAARCPAATVCADPFHVARVGQRRAGPGPPGGRERRPHPWPGGAGSGVQGRAVGAVEEPGGPDRPASGASLPGSPRSTIACTAPTY